MRNIPTKVDGVDTLPAEEFNEFASETENAILASGQILSAGTTDLLGKAMTMHAASSDFYTDSGTADSYVLTPVAAFNAPFQLTEGLRIGWLPGNTNTGASTVNVAGLGVKNIVKSAAASALDAGDLVLNEYAEARYDAGSDTFLLVQSGGVAFGGAGAAAFDIDALPDGTGITLVATDRLAASDQSDSQIDKFIEMVQVQAFMQANLSFGAIVGVQRFIASGTYTPTVGTSAIIVFVTGGGGAGQDRINNITGPSGGTSSFGAFVSATGGGGGITAGGGLGTPGIGIGGIINISGGWGFEGDDAAASDQQNNGGNGGASYWGGGSAQEVDSLVFGAGGASSNNTSLDGGGGGSAGGTAIDFISSGFAGTSVTIGAGGGGLARSGDGGGGVVLILEF